MGDSEENDSEMEDDELGRGDDNEIEQLSAGFSKKKRRRKFKLDYKA